MKEEIEFSSGLWIRSIHPPLAMSQYKLIAFDMDSTLINIECIDEVAELAGKKPEVSAITEAAMRGDLSDYKDSLRQRVALLKGLSVDALSTVYEEKLQFNPGAIELVEYCQKVGLKTLLVSGGFTYFTDRIKDRLKIDFVRSNFFEIKNGLLTGNIAPQSWGEICDGEEKKRMLLSTCEQLNIHPQQTITVGDGANDLLMMGASGLSVAYKAKPNVRIKTNVAIDKGGLDRLLEIIF